MDKYLYESVKTSEDLVEKKSWTPLLRQVLVSSGVLSIYIAIGVCYGAPTIFIQQIRKEANSTDAVSVSMASNLSSIFGYASIPWVFVLTAISHCYGRKKSFLFVGICSMITYICFYFSVTTTHLLLVSIMQGVLNATGLTVSVLILIEFTSTQYRGIFLTMKAASIFWGIWFANAIGTFYHWKYIAMFGFICSLCSLTAFFWPESPHWLASKNRFDECKKSHRWLKGRGVKVEEELKKIMESNEILTFGTLSQIKNKAFYRPIIISGLMILQYYSSGKLVCSVYSIQILKKITSSERSAYTSMLILDGVTVFSMYVGCLFNGIFKRRTQLFSASIASIIFLFIIALYLYLIKLEVVIENNVLTIALVSIFSIAMGCGPGIMVASTCGEIIPNKYKNMCTVFVTIFVQAMNATTLKVFPYIYLEFGLHGTFLCYGLCMTVLTIVLYKILPETKDKTMHEIEEHFKSNSFIVKS